MLSIGSITVDARKIYAKQIEIAEKPANLAVYLALCRHLYSYLYYVTFCRFLHVI